MRYYATNSHNMVFLCQTSIRVKVEKNVRRVAAVYGIVIYVCISMNYLSILCVYLQSEILHYLAKHWLLASHQGSLYFYAIKNT